jgi:magnesium transporter
MDTWSLVDGHWKSGELPGATHWFDLSADDDAALGQLAERFHLHPLAIEDCRSRLIHAPKIDDFGDYLFIVVQGVRPAPDGPTNEELDAFLGRDFLITYQDERIPTAAGVNSVQDALHQGVGMRPGADGMLYEVADRLVDSVLPQLRTLGEQLDAIEEQVLEKQRGPQQREILRLRADAGKIRRLLSPQMAVMQRLGRDEFPQVAAANRVYFRDIYDHLVRIDLGLEGLREDAEVALSTYLSAFNNTVSEVMKVLAVVGTLALPASVIAGIFGTNFENVPLLHERWGFAFMIAIMGGVAGGMALYFRRRRWF